ncbi:RNI-like protein [Anaeromyces robustus]|uniref:RNI-like protein n=1 Tax=Anaeromyces robustus TaxID=1754192 RepID=A0A1Y1XMH1_9FUNG|nr:RNI-like protein [Anaeromyces robustus]|eukprot:ORX86947.1 RNI-like protein [Anaeromyces robustus]
MNYKSILSFICFSAFALANECDDLFEKYDGKYNPDAGSSSELGCFADDDGKISELYIGKYDFSNEVSSKIETLERLYYEDWKITQEVIDNASKQTNLKYFELRDCDFDDNLNFDPLKSLTSLIKIDFWAKDKKMKEFPEFIFSLTSLEAIYLQNQDITEIPDSFENLKNLEILHLRENNMDTEVPQSLNKLPKLRILNLSNNKNIKGKTLTNEHLSYCFYGDNTKDLCKVKNIKCFENSDEKIKSCDNNSSSDDKISTDGTCGKGKGRCPDGKCCSKYGYCGITEKHCLISKGCQSEFGECDSSGATTTTTTKTTTTIKKNLPTSTDGRCGEKYGVCSEGNCCSKYGWCGNSDKYCNEGCQSEFGKCSITKTTTTSKKTTKKSTKTTKQLPTSTNGRCGEKYGVCPSGQCCSKYGWCGKGSEYCKKECQSSYGKCD